MIDICPDRRVVKNEQAVGGWKYKWGKNRKTSDGKVYEDAWIVIFYDEERIPARSSKQRRKRRMKRAHWIILFEAMAIGRGAMIRDATDGEVESSGRENNAVKCGSANRRNPRYSGEILCVGREVFKVV